MALNGKWTLSLETPMGQQVVNADFTSDGAALTGALTNPMLGAASIANGKVDGDTATWSMSITQPMAMTLEYRCKVSGDKLSGTVSAPMGSFAFSGVQA